MTALALIASIEKNGRQDLTVSLEKCSGVKCVVLRVVEKAGDGDQLIPKRSVELNAVRIDQLIGALQQARAIVRRDNGSERLPATATA